YAPAQIVRDARDHGVEVMPVCVIESGWDTMLVGATPPSIPSSPRPQSRGDASSPSQKGSVTPGRARGDEEVARRPLLPLRLGLRVVAGLPELHAARIMAARGLVPFASVEDLWRRSGVPLASLEALARADAFAGMGLDRRQALWAIRGLGEKPLPLLALAERHEPPVSLVPLSAGREVVEDYRATQLTLREHPLFFLRGELAAERIVRCAEVTRLDGKRIEVAGIILVRQKPGSAKGVLFITIEDESGIANIILWPDRFEKQRTAVMSSAMISVVGRVQKEGEVAHVIADRIVDRTPMLRRVGEINLPRMTSPGDGATHPGSPDRGDAGWQPKGRRDYHPPFRNGCDPEEALRQRTHDFR
ncbi:OB-fold nucleic acid binding domain-containing protein, partial [uncultured Sphingomonas sp.]|uniref:helix-hairpin-helix domain-containing protein n=1 Tax=uncultured Sphingomonas sp. TaxID=158754 RepID=UPI0035CA60E4